MKNKKHESERKKKKDILVFLEKDGCAPKKIHSCLKNTYGKAVMDIYNGQLWMKKFGNGQLEIAEKPGNYRRTTVVRDADLKVLMDWL